MSYTHLTKEQRYEISALLSTNCLQKEIAAYLKVSPSTISRELRRNRSLRGYRPKRASELSLERKRAANVKKRKWTPKLESLINKLLGKKISPEQISGRLKREHNIHISHQRIYQHVWEDRKKGGFLYTQLRHQGKPYNKKPAKKDAGRGCIPDRVDISERPKIVEQKTRPGDWEADLIIGKGHSGAIFSLVDRYSKFTLLSRLPNKKASSVTRAIKKLLKSIPAHIPFKTITFDNGKEFAAHKEISELTHANCYFAKPYHSWERGLNEHTNGLVRQYFPKITDFLKVSNRAVRKVQDALNLRPRKVLNYLTPNEVLLDGVKLTE